MYLKEKFNTDEVIGIVEIWESNKGTPTKLLTKKNLIVASAREIIRDLLHNANPGKTINKIKLGDMFMVYGDDTSNLPPPTVTDTALVNEFYSQTFNDTELLVIDGRPALKRTFEITENDANDSNLNVYNKLITEFGLTAGDNTLFSRLVIPIIKTRDIGLIINWTIIV